jgi:hypothetical protein
MVEAPYDPGFKGSNNVWTAYPGMFNTQLQNMIAKEPGI